MITKYGIDVFLVCVFISFVIFFVGTYITNDFFRIFLWIVASFFLVFTLNFFRDPNRITPQIENAIISPADGKIVLIKEVEENEFLKSKAIQISVFMSPLNVHVNRFPISGKVGYFKHIDGKFLVAFEDKSSDVNERTLIGIDSKYGKIFFKQIAGFVARRIVANLKIGDESIVGKRFGMIKFGSRVDVLVPLNTKIKVKLGDVVVGGETVLAEFSK